MSRCGENHPDITAAIDDVLRDLTPSTPKPTEPVPVPEPEPLWAIPEIYQSRCRYSSYLPQHCTFFTINYE